MAETINKTYLDQAGLAKYDELIKKYVDAAEQDAKDYADGLAGDYDAAGTAQGLVDLLKQNEIKDAQDAADKAQADVDDLKEYVGEIPSGNDGKTVVTYAKDLADAAQAAAEATAQGYANEAQAAAEEVANSKVASVTAGNNGIAIGGSETAPTVGLKLSAKVDNDLQILEEEGSEGLYLHVVEGTDYTVTMEHTDGTLAYTFKQLGKDIGTINIPKDMFLQSGEVVNVDDKNNAGTFIKLVLNDEDSTTIYVDVKDLIEYVTSGSEEDDQIVVNVSNDHKVTATLSNGSIVLAQLDENLQAAIGKANSALQASDITTGTGNGTIAVKGTDVAVQGLGSAAFEETTAFDAAGKAAEEAGKVLGAEADDATKNTVYGNIARIAGLQDAIDGLEAVQWDRITETYIQGLFTPAAEETP